MSGTDLPTYTDSDIIRAERSTLAIQHGFNKNENAVGDSQRFIISFKNAHFLVSLTLI